MSEDFGISGCLLETRSLDTWQNAAASAVILRGQHFSRPYLVSHARDMKRVLWAFRRNGIEGIAAPTGFDELAPTGVGTVLPNGKALLNSYYALYELFGGVAYRLIH
jgi:uncharacterized SAM-binding protein YcdF (DUF218 family)